MRDKPSVEGLKPCPHCGGKAAFVPRAVNLALQKDPSDPKFGVSVICGTCSAETGNFIDEAAASLRWNRRASAAAPAAQPATPLREVLSDEQRSAEREAFVSWASRRFASTWPHLPQHSRSLMLDAWQARALLADSSDERKSLEALETARSGLLWYRDSFPAANSQADDEAMEQIDAAIAALRSRLDGEKT